jgi:IS605 OrfB family transposase
MDGRKIKSINQYWNKRKAYLQSIATKQGSYTTNRINRITDKRNNQVRDIIKKTARYIVDYCRNNDIGTIIVGYNPDFKESVNLGKKNNQTFVQIPFGDLRNDISNLCERYGISYIEQEESYTSKASALDEDVIPTYNPSAPYQDTFSGKRVHRGLYKSKNGTFINADVNGSANILRKCKQNISIDELCPGLLASPQRIRLL